MYYSNVSKRLAQVAQRGDDTPDRYLMTAEPMQTAFSWHPHTRAIGPFADSLDTLAALVRGGHGIRVTRQGLRRTADATPVLLCQTSGSSGAPKTIARSHASWIASFETNKDLFALSPSDCVATFGAMEHSLALYATLEAAHVGARICPLAGLRPDAQLTELRHARATVLYITPTQIGLICRHAPIAPLTHVRHILVGGGPLSEGLAGQASAHFPQARITPFYGASETSFIAIGDDRTPPGAVGRPYPGVTLSLRDPGGHPASGSGEIWVHSPYLFHGYAVGDSADTRWSDGYLSVGEMGRIDAEGYLYVLGRKSRMVLIADICVYPEAVEDVLASLLPGCTVAVVPRLDTRRGAQLVAFVEPGPEGVHDTATALRVCRNRIGPMQTPRELVVVPQMPRLTSGKPDLIALRNSLCEAS